MLISESESSSSLQGVELQFARLSFTSSLGSRISLQGVKSAGSCAVRVWFGWLPALVEGTIMAAVGLGRQVSRLQSHGAGQQGNLCVARSVSILFQKNDSEELIDLEI